MSKLYGVKVTVWMVLFRVFSLIIGAFIISCIVPSYSPLFFLFAHPINLKNKCTTSLLDARLKSQLIGRSDTGELIRKLKEMQSKFDCNYFDLGMEEY